MQPAKQLAFPFISGLVFLKCSIFVMRTINMYFKIPHKLYGTNDLAYKLTIYYTTKHDLLRVKSRVEFES